MLTRQSSPRVLLSDVEYLALKIAFSPGCSAQWYIDHLCKYTGVSVVDADTAFDSALWGGFVAWRIASEVPTIALKRKHLKGVPSSDIISGYVVTLTGLDIARDAAVKIGIDPDTILA